MVICCHGTQINQSCLVNLKDILLLSDCIKFELHIFWSLGKRRANSISPKISDRKLRYFRHYRGVRKVGKPGLRIPCLSSDPRNSRMAIAVQHITFFSILKALSYASNSYFVCSSPLTQFQSNEIFVWINGSLIICSRTTSGKKNESKLKTIFRDLYRNLFYIFSK